MPTVCELHRRVQWNHFTSKQSPAEPEAPFSPTELWPGTIAAHSISPLASQNQAVTRGHRCLALNTCPNTYTLMLANPPVSPLSAPRSKWLITNLTPGTLEACAHLRSLRGLMHREPDCREMEKWNCQPGCYADTLGANRMKLCVFSWEAVHIGVCFQGKMSYTYHRQLWWPSRPVTNSYTDGYTQTVLGSN